MGRRRLLLLLLLLRRHILRRSLRLGHGCRPCMLRGTMMLLGALSLLLLLRLRSSCRLRLMLLRWLHIRRNSQLGWLLRLSGRLLLRRRKILLLTGRGRG